MLISATIIKRPRKKRGCSGCLKVIDGPQLRLYGAADMGERPYAMYIHPECTGWQHPKILAAKVTPGDQARATAEGE